MRMHELTKYQKSRMCRCIYCGKEITEFQEFEFTYTKFGRCNIYVFIHSDCIVAAQDWLKDTNFERLQKAAAIGAIRYYDTDSVAPYKVTENVKGEEDDGK